MTTPDIETQDSLWTPIRLKSGTFSHMSFQCEISGVDFTSIAKFNDLYEIPIGDFIGVIYAYRYLKKPVLISKHKEEQNLGAVAFSPYRKCGNRCVTSSLLDICYNKNINVTGLDQIHSLKNRKSSFSISIPNIEEATEVKESHDDDNALEELNDAFHFISYIFKNEALYEFNGSEKKPCLVKKVLKNENNEKDWIHHLVEHLKKKIERDSLEVYCAAITRPNYLSEEIKEMDKEIKKLEKELNQFGTHPFSESSSSPRLTSHDMTSEESAHSEKEQDTKQDPETHQPDYLQDNPSLTLNLKEESILHTSLELQTYEERDLSSNLSPSLERIRQPIEAPFISSTKRHIPHTEYVFIKLELIEETIAEEEENGATKTEQDTGNLLVETKQELLNEDEENSVSVKQEELRDDNFYEPLDDEESLLLRNNKSHIIQDNNDSIHLKIESLRGNKETHQTDVSRELQENDNEMKISEPNKEINKTIMMGKDKKDSQFEIVTETYKEEPIDAMDEEEIRVSLKRKISDEDDKTAIFKDISVKKSCTRQS